MRTKPLYHCLVVVPPRDTSVVNEFVRMVAMPQLRDFSTNPYWLPPHLFLRIVEMFIAEPFKMGRNGDLIFNYGGMHLFNTPMWRYKNADLYIEIFDAGCAKRAKEREDARLERIREQHNVLVREEQAIRRRDVQAQKGIRKLRAQLVAVEQRFVQKRIKQPFS